MKSFFSLEVDLICDAHERVDSSSVEMSRLCLERQPSLVIVVDDVIWLNSPQWFLARRRRKLLIETLIEWFSFCILASRTFSQKAKKCFFDFQHSEILEKLKKSLYGMFPSSVPSDIFVHFTYMMSLNCLREKTAWKIGEKRKGKETLESVICVWWRVWKAKKRRRKKSKRWTAMK